MVRKNKDGTSDIVKNKLQQLGFTLKAQGITMITNRNHQEYVSNNTYDKETFIQIMDKVADFLEGMGRGTTFNGGLGKDNKIYLVVDIDTSMKDKNTVKDLQPVGMNGMFSINCRKIQEAEKLYSNYKFQEAKQKFDEALYSTYDSGILTNSGINTVANKKLAKQWLDKYNVIGILQKHPEYNNAAKQILTKLSSLKDVDTVKDNLIQSSSKEAFGENKDSNMQDKVEYTQAMLKSDIAEINRKAKQIEQRIKSGQIKTFKQAKMELYNAVGKIMNDVATSNMPNLLDKLDAIIQDTLWSFKKMYNLHDSKINDELGYYPEVTGQTGFNDLEDIVHNTIKYIKQKYPNEENTMDKWLVLIGEEFGELCQAINDNEINNVIEEGTQTIAAIYLMLSDFIINAVSKE